MRSRVYKVFKSMTDDETNQELGGQTTSYERKLRRRNVVRLRFGSRMSAPEIAEELGCSEATIYRDFEWIDDQLSKMESTEFIDAQVKAAVMQLFGHEMDDLRRAEQERDEKAKHRAKSSLRSTIKMLRTVSEDVDGAEQEDSVEEFIESLPGEAKEQVREAAEDTVENILESG